MSKYLCANLDKEEYLEFGEFPDNIKEDSATNNTLKYFLATEWAGDQIMFFFDGERNSRVFPDEENAYNYVTRNYLQRCVLKTVPKYRFTVNTSKEEYFFTDALPKAKDDSCISPLPFILAEKENGFLLDYLDSNEANKLGSWENDRILVTNNEKSVNLSYKIFESPYYECYYSTHAIEGKKIVVTGEFAGFSRFEIEKHIEELGGIPQKSVTKKTDFLVVADFRPGTKKLDDARKYGIKTITAKEFFEMIGE